MRPIDRLRQAKSVLEILLALGGITVIGILVATLFLPVVGGKDDRALILNAVAWTVMFLSAEAGLIALSVAGRRRAARPALLAAGEVFQGAVYDTLLLLGGVYLDVVAGICLQETLTKPHAPADAALFGGLAVLAAGFTAFGVARFVRYLRGLGEG